MTAVGRGKKSGEFVVIHNSQYWTLTDSKIKMANCVTHLKHQLLFFKNVIMQFEANSKNILVIGAISSIRSNYGFFCI